MCENTRTDIENDSADFMNFSQPQYFTRRRCRCRRRRPNIHQLRLAKEQ